MNGGDFWSRRKAAVAAEAEADQVALQAELAAQEQATLEERSDEEILEELGLKDPDTLVAGDDFSAFLKSAVPERLRRRALRRLWLSNPMLANLDGMVDYGEDFTDAKMAVEKLQTAYQVGKGMLKHVEALAEQAAKEDGEAESETPEVPPQDEVAALEGATKTEPSYLFSKNTNAEESSEEAEMSATDDTPLPRRRMRFEFT